MMVHGRNGYTNWGCRCLVCREAQRLYAIGYRDRNRAKFNATQRIRNKRWRAANLEKSRTRDRAYYRTHGGTSNGRIQRREVQYRMPKGAFENLLAAQNGRCAICLAKFITSSREYAPHIDHDHATDQVRGLLCASCNRGLGHFKDSLEFLESAKIYLSS
jgi:hypothetical protein